jgi:hypothetical protein
MKKQENTKKTGVLENNGQCVGIHELVDWQIIQYRQAVDAHRLDLSKAEGRCVAWQEAEKDFNKADRAAMDEKWRVEYCGMVCPQSNKCLIALHFLHSKKTEPLYRAG